MSERDVLDEAFAALREEHGGASDAARATRQTILLARAAQAKRRSVVVRLVLPIAAVLAIGTAWAAISGRLFPTPTEPSPPPQPHPHPQPQPQPPPQPQPQPAPAPAPASASASASAPPRPHPDPEEAAYRAAHAAHFVDKQPARALELWDAYLASYPSGRFAPEARYNRAISLIRLGRTAEARDALRPFAEAKPGSYRQAEARQLLEAIE